MRHRFPPVAGSRTKHAPGRLTGATSRDARERNCSSPLRKTLRGATKRKIAKV